MLTRIKPLKSKKNKNDVSHRANLFSVSIIAKPKRSSFLEKSPYFLCVSSHRDLKKVKEIKGKSENKSQ